MSAHSHNNLCEYLSFSQCCCFPVVGSAWFGSFFPPFFGQMCVLERAPLLYAVYIYSFMNGEINTTFWLRFFFCYYIAIVSFDLA